MCSAVKLRMGVNGASVWPFGRTSNTVLLYDILSRFEIWLKQYCFFVSREVRRVGGAHSCLAPIMSQDHRQLDSSLICRVILSLIQSNPFVSIPVKLSFQTIL
ncbi:hypothetical protein Ahy_A09g044608 [Arachis hypogaea]|uniref:Uncharacterized protein n=1 Tax=Arachis hypogaea TaxID=3818 RepID=A0A445BKF9_ARAHY|nr:hypothetical protein Ahy_A09g044608 [Arachis hypogaea]